jgi:Arc/MetJ-type ribon-helix-helix transcriptional regulator
LHRSQETAVTVTVTVTVKLDPALAEQLRRRATTTGRSASEVIRQALGEYLSTPPRSKQRSPHALGHDLFGRFRGDPRLAEQRKIALADLWATKHAARKPPKPAVSKR